jgi:hypothetical protein
VSETLPLEELLAAGPDDRDWSDVVRRASRVQRRRRGSVVFTVVAVFCLGIAAAYASGHPIIDFSKAPKGPRTVVDDFGSLEVGAPAGMAPGVLPHEARRVTAVTIDGKRHVLWVAPTTKGGFCAAWTTLITDCRVGRHGPYPTGLQASGMYHAYPKEGTSVLVQGGSFLQRAGAKLELVYEDGASDEIPFVWVTEPIDAGFYIFRVPSAHRVAGHYPKEVRLYDGAGRLLDSAPANDAGVDVADLDLNLHRVPGYPPLSVPSGAIWEQRRQLFDLRADDGSPIGLWVAPSRTGKTCYWSNQSGACSRSGEETHPLALGLSGAATHVTLCCTVGPSVARVEAQFEDGDRVELTPKEGYLVWPISSRHYPRGHRLEKLVAFDTIGHKIAAQPFDTRAAGLYPCTRPKDLGYGVSMCP